MYHSMVKKRLILTATRALLLAAVFFAGVAIVQTSVLILGWATAAAGVSAISELRLRHL